jgi:Fic family protein
MLTDRFTQSPRSSTKQMTSSIGELLVRVQGEYLEMPGLTLTEVQAQRLWGLDPSTCTMVLAELVDRKFLRRADGNSYRRASE